MKSRLTWYLLGLIVIAAIVSVGVAYGVMQLGLYYVENEFDDQEINQRFQKKYIADLQQYINDNNITEAEMRRLDKWASDNPYVYFSVYKNNTVIYNSDYTYDSVDTDTKASENVLEDTDSSDLENSLFNSEYFYQLKLADGLLTSVDIFCYDYWNYNNYVYLIAGILGILIFVIVFTRGISRKIAYINQLEQEIRILEGGNLEYPITIKGVDELGSLAGGIDQMRQSIIYNQKQEEKVLQANKDLVTAMSHDLRTPLTTLTGYLELLNMDDMTDCEKKKHYLELSLDKAREIRELSDELFEYFLVYDEDNRHIEMESVPATALVEDLIENQFLSLEEDGFTISGKNDIEDDKITCLINPRYMRRVLNNILSNLMKYAEKESPIEVNAKEKDDCVVIRVKNTIKKNLDKHESTRIGLVTCERIMKLHRGAFNYNETEDEFEAELVIPVR